MKNKQTQDFVIQRGYLVSFNGTEKVVKIPSNVTCIGKNSFCNSHIEEVEFPEGLDEIEGNAFENSDLKSIVVTGNIRKVGFRAFPSNEILDASVFNQIPISKFSGADKEYAIRFYIRNYNMITNEVIDSQNISYLGKNILKSFSFGMIFNQIISDDELFIKILKSNTIQRKDLDSLIQYAADIKHTEKVALLIDYKEKHLGENQRANIENGLLEFELPVSEYRKLFKFSYKKDYIEITGCSDIGDQVIVPSYIGKKSVKVIGRKAFDGHNLQDIAFKDKELSIKRKIVISEGVSEIKSGAFFCISDREIYIPESVKSLPSGMFVAIESVTLFLPSNIKDIPSDIAWDSPANCLKIIKSKG